jgi:hypothetical protein
VAFGESRQAFLEDASDLAEDEALIIQPSGERGASVVAGVEIDEWPPLNLLAVGSEQSRL